MKAVITGASSGIGRSMAVYLSSIGYEVCAAARNEDALIALSKSITTDYSYHVIDLSCEKNCYELYEKLKNEKIDIFINNAGFGVYGEFTATSLKRETDMLRLNITAVHILTKLFVNKMARDGGGIVLNVASTAGFMMGPLLSSYYASKAYVLRLSQAIDEELRQSKSSVRVAVLCPGPVKTGFDKVAGVSASLRGHSAQYTAQYAIDKALKGKRIIIPGVGNKILVMMSKFVPERLLAKINYRIQKKKGS